MSGQRESIPGYYRPSGESYEAVPAVLELGALALSHVEGFVVLVASIVCIAAGYLLWVG
jgi:hypothetical protein